MAASTHSAGSTHARTRFTSEGLAALMRDVSAGRTVGSASIAPCSRAVHSRTTSAHRCSEYSPVGLAAIAH